MKRFILRGLLVVGVGCVGYVYTLNANGVSSLFMTFAFAWLLLGYALQWLFTHWLVAKRKRWVNTLHRGLLLSYMLNATLGSIVIGVIEIAGSYSDWVMVQLGVGLVSLALYMLMSMLIVWCQH